MSRKLLIQRALRADAPAIDGLLLEWFEWKPKSGRLKSVERAIRKRELIVSETGSRIIGFIHYIMHEDIIDGGPNTFISAFYVSKADRGKGHRNGPPGTGDCGFARERRGWRGDLDDTQTRKEAL